MKPQVPPTAAPAHAGAPECRWTLRAEPHGLHEVRRAVRARLRAWGREELTLPAAMCVTELLSNVHKHARSPECELTMRGITRGIRISVIDREPRLPVAGEPGHLSRRGRGLFLLGGTVDAWGALPVPGGKEVWFTLHADDDHSPAAPHRDRAHSADGTGDPIGGLTGEDTGGPTTAGTDGGTPGGTNRGRHA
ncbi:ATP-binding protein [Streptantibioticus silvisoli]|uniref:ATP-binding protein n=1 Tax=Streptantibioticus silvisoli TaxID=2705255 RepID=A0ABT6W3A6_9ACTN|nr:ATP-binding protein [Streptantibioticus silvisoli]MDI5965219.1 ATP-binding protein [Streptantibioticus silvisoli]